MARTLRGAPSDRADAESSESDLTQTATDAAIQGKLRGIIKDVTFMSEGDFPYVVFEGDAVTEKRLSTKLVREKLQAAVKANSSGHRDILPASCRAVRLDVGEAIATGNAAEVPANRDDDNFTAELHDKQLMIALKTMRSQLRGVVGFTFGTNASGDQDEVGTVLFVYVGISKTTGKLIAIMTEAVFT
jgi:hypothetical protein